MRHWLAVWFWMGALVFPSHSQIPPEFMESSDRQGPPASGILDPSGFFNRNPDAMKRISGQLRKLEEDHAYMIYLVVEPMLITTTAPDRASELRQEWVPDGNGMVLVFESDTRNLGIGRDLVGQQAPPGNPVGVASYETAAIITRAAEASDPQLPPDVYLEALMENLTTEFRSYFKRRATPPPAARSVRIAMLVIGTLALLGLGAICVGALVRYTGMAAVRTFRFPPVDRPERLGAPCGGSVTARRFAPRVPQT